MTSELSIPVNEEASKASDHRWLILLFVAIAQLMVVLDATVVNIALPSAQKDLGFADSERQWIITAYALAFGSLLLLGGRVGDLFGRKRMFLIGLAGFAIASALGGAAPSFGVLVTARALQGVAGAMLAPAALSTLMTTFHDPRDRGRAFGVFGSVAVGGGAVGLILGGVLTEYVSWRWCMYVNVAFAVVAAFGATVYMVNERPTTRPRIDYRGVVLASAGLFLIVFGFSRAEASGWLATITLVALAAGVVLLGGFGYSQQHAPVPLLPLRVLADRSRAMAFASVLIAGIAMFSVFLFVTYYMQLVQGMSPVTSGLAFLPMVACIMVSSNLSNMVTLPRFGPRIVITIGMSLGCVSLAYLTQLDTGSSYAGGLLPSLLGMGVAMGMVMAPAMNVATAGVRPEDAGVASALVSTMQQVGGSVGTAALSTVAASVTASYVTNHPGRTDLTLAAATHGYTVAFIVSSSLFAIGAVLGATLFPSRTRLDELRQSGLAIAASLENAMPEVVAAEI